MGFSSDAIPEGLVVRLHRRHLLRKQVVPVNDWGRLSGTQQRLAAFLLSLRDEGNATLHDGAGDGEGLLVSHDAAVRLPASVAEAIGVPPLTSLSITLSFEGLMTDPDGHIRIRWYDENTQAIRPGRCGCIVSWADGRRRGRLSETIFRLVEAADAYNASEGQPPAARISAWMPVQNGYRDVTGRQVKADDYLSHLTLYQAGAMALDVRQTADGPDFVPIVMHREKAAGQTDDEAPIPEAAEDPSAVVRPRDAISDALLPADLQQGFLQSFVRETETRQAYVLGRQQYLVIEPGLRSALDVVRQKRRASRSEREEFVRNPRPALAGALKREKAAVPGLEAEADGWEERSASLLLVETHQYAERVIGLEIWQKPSLPWLQTPSGQWMPERFPVRIGSATVVMDQKESEKIVSGYTMALEAGDGEMVVQGQRISTEQVGHVLESLGLARPAAAAPDPANMAADGGEAPASASSGATDLGGDGSDSALPAERQVLQILQNFEGVDYRMSHARRVSVLSNDFPVGSLTRSLPKPHQEDGFRWLAEAWVAGWPGVLLADDMGLGKTFQALAFLAWVRKNRSRQGMAEGVARQPVLVVAPTALLRNWIEEAERHLQPDVLGKRIDAFGYGLNRLRLAQPGEWAQEDSLDVARLRSADWVLTTYETLANHHRAFARVAFSVALFDEAQKIKMPGTINTQAAKAMNADFTLTMTGTPIENRLADLWCIMDRAIPGYLGELKGFVKRYENGAEAELEELKTKLDRPDTRTPAPMLRRMKVDILEGLPRREVRKVKMPMPPEQALAYARARLDAQNGGRRHGDMLRAIHAFRGVSLHPEKVENVDPFDPASVDLWVGKSARLMQTMTVLEEIAARGEKALVFLEDLTMQRIFATAAATKFALASTPAIINGSVPGERRLAIVDGFQNAPAGFDLLVLSPKAAGVGLTITAANHVIHLSRWWNPAVEDQCNDRCYRIGQHKPVTVHVPIAVHPALGEASFDVTLDRLLENKRSLSRHMLRPPVEDSDLEILFGEAVNAA
ncbi:DEAD/DEAH box helicase [Hoeflea olei]|uniref:Helicase n=1 Tax=Hoeflea olei TaxID=1480615 RepID=A0A1C1YU40_9HYPH|nr:DEAD/DEAH box helicase [Hoeflea olei]OCW57068.1 hypothetical protein AWJ14_07915 [Hoeflea olei]